MLRHTIEWIRVNTVFIADEELHDRASAVQPHARLDQAAGLRTPAERVADAEELSAGAGENADASVDGMVDEDVHIAQPRIVDERVLDGAASFEIEVHGGLSDRDAAQQPRTELG